MQGNFDIRRDESRRGGQVRSASPALCSLSSGTTAPPADPSIYCCGTEKVGPFIFAVLIYTCAEQWMETLLHEEMILAVTRAAPFHQVRRRHLPTGPIIFTVLTGGPVYFRGTNLYLRGTMDENFDLRRDDFRRGGQVTRAPPALCPLS